MELPRGRFIRVMRDTVVSFLFRDLSDNCFTGYCIMTNDQINAVVVLEKGRIVLAEYNNFMGNSALKCFDSCMNIPVNAQINELNELQLELALEFNSNCGVQEEFEEHRSAFPQEGETITSDFQSGPGSYPDSFISKQQPMTKLSIRMPIVEDTAENDEVKREISALLVKSSETEDIPKRAQAFKCGEQETSNWRLALTMPITPADGTSQSPSEEEQSAKMAQEKPGLIFEPLNSDSPLFEQRPFSNGKPPKIIQDTVEKWQFMSVNTGENTFV
jgi:hypothetical protein